MLLTQSYNMMTGVGGCAVFMGNLTRLWLDFGGTVIKAVPGTLGCSGVPIYGTTSVSDRVLTQKLHKYVLKSYLILLLVFKFA